MPEIIPGVKTYDPTKVSLIVGGSIIKSWNTITCVVDDPKFTFATGTTGEVTRTKNPIMMGTATIDLPQTSEDNAILSAFEVAGNTIPIIVVDRNGVSIHTMPQATIIKPADAEYGKDSGSREWEIKGQWKEPFIVGGN